MLRVRPADVADMQVIVGFIDEAARWLPAKNTDQWSRPWPDLERRNHRIRRGLEAGRTWLVEDDGIPVATVSCRDDANADLWTDEEQLIPAVYVARLIVARSHAGQYLGQELLDWAGYWAAAQYGAIVIRIDVWTTNAELQNYYEKLGFRLIRFAHDVDYPSAALLEKETAGITRADISRLREEPRLPGPASQPGPLSLTGWRSRRRADHVASAAFAHLTGSALFLRRSGRFGGSWRRG
jgi:ribosomal protein S18 acetylase RimI-like enzyme